jgi:predicted nuclease of predicted toxin-antitoxin system
MKLLFDQNLSYRLCQDIAEIFSGSNHVRLLDLAEADDRAIWDFARANAYKIVSQDADFAEMAVLMGSPPKVIWIRAGNQSRAQIATLLLRQADLILTFENDEAVCLEIY